LNQLLYDSEASHSSHNAKEYISSAIDDYYRRNSRRLAPGIIANPRLTLLITSMQESATSSPGELTECLSYLTYTCHGAPHMRDRMVSILQSTIDSLQSSDAAEDKERSIVADYKIQQKKEKALREAKGEPEAGHKEKYRKMKQSCHQRARSLLFSEGTRSRRRNVFFRISKSYCGVGEKNQECEASVSRSYFSEVW
jgi:hypothetical protein